MVFFEAYCVGAGAVQAEKQVLRSFEAVARQALYMLASCALRTLVEAMAFFIHKVYSAFTASVHLILLLRI